MLGESAPLAFAAYENGQNIEAYAAVWEQAEKLYGKRTSLTPEQIMERSPVLLESLTEDQLRLAVALARHILENSWYTEDERAELRRGF